MNANRRTESAAHRWSDPRAYEASIDVFVATHPDPDVREGFTETLRLRRELERCMRGLLDATTELEIARFGLYVERNATRTARRWRVVVEAWEASQ